MKSYTDLSQSKKLAEILPIESSDMHYILVDTDEDKYDAGLGKYIGILPHYPCWSLAALLGVLNKTAYFMDEDANVMLDSYKTVEWDLGINNSDIELVTESNPIDACYEMIIKLNEQKLI